MKHVALSLALFAASLPAFAAPKHDFTTEKDLSVSCASSVMELMEADKEISSYLEDQMTVSLEWYDDEKTEVAFTFNFGEDVRDGYMTGRVLVEKTARGCRALKVTNTSVGD